MKMKAKLIPLTSIAIMSATIAPISLTSCNTDVYIGRSFNVCKPFFPTVEKHKAASLTVELVNNTYAEQLKKDPTTFVQDFMWSESTVGDAFEQFLFWEKLLNKPTPNENKLESTPIGYITRDVIGDPNNTYEYNNFVISGLDISFEQLVWDHQGWTIPRLSFTLSFNSKINETYFSEKFGQDYVSGYLNGLCNGTIKFYNVPFIITSKFAYYRNLDYAIKVNSFEPFALWMSPKSFDPTKAPTQDIGYWSIKANIVSTLSGEIIYSSGVTQRIADDWVLYKEADNDKPDWTTAGADRVGLYNTLTSLFTSSYYLQSVTILE